MPNSYERIDAPRNNYVPANPVMLQGRINPKAFGIKQPSDADYRVPPRTLVFTHKSRKSSSGFSHSRQSIHVTKQARREGSVCDVVCNFYETNTGSGDRDYPELRFLGVSDDGVADARGAQTHPDAVGRFSVIVSGAVNVLCDKKDLEDINVGDKVVFKPESNYKTVAGLPKNFTTCSLEKATVSSGNGDESTFFPTSNDNFRYIFTGKSLPPLENTLFSAKINVPLLQAAFKLGTTFAQMYFKTDAKSPPLIENTNLDNVPEGIEISDSSSVGIMNPKETVRAYAVFYLSLIGVTANEAGISPSGFDINRHWVDVLYNPQSKYWCEESQPLSDMDPKWIDHCFGYNGLLKLKINEGQWAFTDSDFNCVAGGRTLGWFYRLIVPLLCPDDGFKWAWADRSKAVAKAEEVITKDDVISKTGGNSATVKTFTSQILGAPGQNEFFSAIYGSSEGYYKTGNESILKSSVAIYGASENEFKEKQTRVKERMTVLGLSPKLFSGGMNQMFLQQRLELTTTNIPAVPGPTFLNKNIDPTNIFGLVDGLSDDLNPGDAMNKSVYLKLMLFLTLHARRSPLVFDVDNMKAKGNMVNLERLAPYFFTVCAMLATPTRLIQPSKDALKTEINSSNTLKDYSGIMTDAKKVMTPEIMETINYNVLATNIQKFYARHEKGESTWSPGNPDVIGVLLEKYADSNEARILLTPGGC